MTQPQREAVLDLVILALFADSHLSLKEDERLQAALDKIGWESVKPREIFFCNSMNRARKASDSEAATNEYITARVKDLNVWSKSETLSLLESLLASDGVTALESAFLVRVKSAMA